MWASFARREEIDRRMEAINAVRVGMADHEGYARRMAELGWARTKLVKGAQAATDDSFSAFFAFAGGG